MTAPTIFKSFVSEKDIEELKKKKQEEWEKVRKPDQPQERPEEVHDSRTLYERLKEQKDKKQEEWDEQFKFKNMIYKGLDDEEAGFLAFVVKQQAEQKALVNRREKEEVSAFKEAVAKLRDEAEFSTSLAQLSPSDLADSAVISSHSAPAATPMTIDNALKPSKSPKSQLALIAGSIKTKRKRNSSDSVINVGTTSPEKKARISSFSSAHSYDAGGEEGGEEGREGGVRGDGQEKCVEEQGQQQQTECGNIEQGSNKIGALSGLTAYSSSDSSDAESYNS